MKCWVGGEGVRKQEPAGVYYRAVVCETVCSQTCKCSSVGMGCPFVLLVFTQYFLFLVSNILWP